MSGTASEANAARLREDENQDRLSSRQRAAAKHLEEANPKAASARACERPGTACRPGNNPGAAVKRRERPPRFFPNFPGTATPPIKIDRGGASRKRHVGHKGANARRSAGRSKTAKGQKSHERRRRPGLWPGAPSLMQRLDRRKRRNLRWGDAKGAPETTAHGVPPVVHLLADCCPAQRKTARMSRVRPTSKRDGPAWKPDSAGALEYAEGTKTS